MPKVSREDVKTGGTILLYGFIVFIGYKGMQKLGLVGDQNDKLAKKLDTLAGRWQSDEFLISVGKKYLDQFKKKPTMDMVSALSYEKAKEIGKNIYDSKGTFSDDEDKLYTNFRELNTGTDFYRINYIFKKKYGRSVLDYVTGFTNPKERGKIYNIIKGLPDFIKK